MGRRAVPARSQPPIQCHSGDTPDPGRSSAERAADTPAAPLISSTRQTRPSQPSRLPGPLLVSADPSRSTSCTQHDPNQVSQRLSLAHMPRSGAPAAFPDTNRHHNGPRHSRKALVTTQATHPSPHQPHHPNPVSPRDHPSPRHPTPATPADHPYPTRHSPESLGVITAHMWSEQRPIT